MKNKKKEAVNHPSHYGGKNNPYEAIKVIEAWKLGFNLGNSVKYIARMERKGAPVQDLEKAIWYLTRELNARRCAQTVGRTGASRARRNARRATRSRRKTQSG